MMPVAFVGACLWPTTRRYIIAHWREALLLLAFPVIGLVWDLLSHTPPGLYLRGLSRNLVFGVCAVVMMAMASRLSRAKMLVVFLALAAAVPIAAIIQTPFEVTSVMIFVKYFGGWSMTFWLMLVIARLVSPMTAGIIMMPLGLTIALALSYRSLGGVLVLAGLFAVSAHLWKRMPRGGVIACVMVLPVVIAAIAISIFQGDYVPEQLRSDWDYSNFQRLDMAVDAWRGFCDSPLWGSGSWAHAVRYTDVSQPGILVGVHSFILQFAFEYGVFGLLFGCWLLWLAVGGTVDFLQSNHPEDIRWMPMLLLVMLNLVYAILMSPMGGYERILAGTALGISLAQIHRRRAFVVQ
ncbi:O-antigen ligase family protein [Nibricoccus aquaticus]|nr:O-antigen ligase family protein [Nibricoccus aquaticus]